MTLLDRYLARRMITAVLQIMVDIETLLGLSGSPATLADGTVLDPEVARHIAGDARWQRLTKGEITLDRIDALSLGLDSWGGEPFTVWLDGLTVD